MKDINFETMRIRLEFCFRLMQQLSRRVQAPQDFQYAPPTDEQVSHFLSLLVSQGAALIYLRRRNNAFEYTDQEMAYTREVARVIVEKFDALQVKIYNETHGYPLSLVLVQEEAIIIEGIDEILESVKDMLSYFEKSS